MRQISYFRQLPTPQSVASYYLEFIPSKPKKVFETMDTNRMRVIFDELLESSQVSSDTKTAILQTSIYGKK